MKTLVNSLLIAILCFSAGSIARAQYVDFYFDANYDCAPMTVNFFNVTDTSGIVGLAEWDWYIEGQPSYYTKEPPPITFTEGGYFEVTLTLYDDIGYVGEATYYIYVYSDPDAFFMSTGPNACPGEPVDFYFDETVSWYSVLWDFGDATIAIRDQMYADHIFYNPGVYDVTLTLDHTCGMDTIVQQINVADGAVPQVEAYVEGNPEICPNEVVSFNTMEDHYSYEWDFGDGTTSDERNPSHFFESQVASNYWVTVKVTNSCGGIGKDSVEIQIVDAKEADAWFYMETHQGENTACPNTAVQFIPENSGTTYLWNFGDGSYSEEKSPVNYYTEEGLYHVTLILVNGCGEEAVHTDSIEIYKSYEDELYAEFSIRVEGMSEEELYRDTITVCPGEPVQFDNYSYASEDADVKYIWDFGDGLFAFSRDAEHAYTETGLQAVTLTLNGPCGGTSYTTRYILVDDGRFPDTKLSVVPHVICNGETVYFYDDRDYKPGRYRYDIDFGDGNLVTDIRDYSDPVLHTLAEHVYTGLPGQTYIASFNATNDCGLTTSRTDTITITDDPAHKPFYYVQNTTTSEDNQPFNDWSVRRDTTDHEFIINVQWSGWPGTNNRFAVYFWYGELDPGDPGPPTGYVTFTTDQIVDGASVTAYVPISPIYPSSVGLAAVWTCSGFYEQTVEPEVSGIPMDFGGMPLTSFPLSEDGFTDLGSISNPIQLDGDWDGICNEQRPADDYVYELNPNTFIHLSFDEDLQYYYLDAYYDRDGNNWMAGISWGTYNLMGGNEIEFMGMDHCTDIGLYTYSVTPDQITFTPVTDLCPDRQQYLSAQPFDKKPDYDLLYSPTACPNDMVNFVVAGGVSWEWHFGDDSTSTEQNPTHRYANAGDYNAFVVATNACGRRDTVYSPVRVSSESLPPAVFWTDDWDFPRLEPIQFWWGYPQMDPAGNVQFEWNFGDGTPLSTVMNPIHTFEREGDYQISLTVSNGCGSNSYTEWIYVREALRRCEAKFNDSIVGQTVHFRDISRGEVSSWFWDFGDGTTSFEQNPSHTYKADGFYFVCLSIVDEVNNCAHQVCREIQVGSVNCKANFISSCNDATRTVQFTDRSQNAEEWFWDFGDGYFSGEKNPAHQYKEPGMYVVCLSTYSSTNDCFSEICKEVEVDVSESDFCYAEFSFFVDDDNSVRFTDESSANITNWYWTFGDGKYTDSRNPIHFYTAPGIYGVSLFVFDQVTGCVAEIFKEVAVGISGCNQNAKFSYFVDASYKATFSNRSTGDITEFFWDFGDGTTSTKANPTHVYEAPGFYLVTLSVWDDNTDCSDYAAEFLQIGTANCRAAFEYQVDPTTNNVKFYNQSIGNMAEYFWYFDDGTFEDVPDPSHHYEYPGMYLVSLTVISVDGLCMDFISHPVQVGNVECAARFKYFIDSANNVAYFRPESMGSATAYLWYFGDGAISTEKETVHRFAQPGYYTVGLNTFDEATGCMDYHEEVILIGRAGQDCRAGFTYMSDPDTYTVKFGNRSKGKIVEYIWDFGDGTMPSNDPNPVHQYTEGGYPLVCLTVVNNYGIPNTYCEFVQLATSDAERCFAEFHYNVDSASKTVEFVQESWGNPDGFHWDFGDGQTSNSANIEHTYSEAGYYPVELMVSNSVTGCKNSRFKLINVAEGNQGLRASFSYTADSSQLKAGTYPTDFVGISLGDAGKLKWEFDDGKVDTTTLNPTHIYNAPGKYNVCLTVSNPNTQDEYKYCEDVFTLGYTGIDPQESWHNWLGNYPNPFENTTTIVYELVSGTPVDLAIFDQTGRMVDILVREDQIAGTYRIEYDGAWLDSGIYTLRLATREGVYTARMVVR